jgi:D-arabinose 1-dehydrogenase-like Zn-dependent alcohol dehydrogenase
MDTIAVVTFDGPGAPPRMNRVPRPEVPPRAALIRIDSCGVCGTDLHILKGHWPKPLPWPITLGHELTGVIDEIGPELTTEQSA